MMKFATALLLLSGTMMSFSASPASAAAKGEVCGGAEKVTCDAGLVCDIDMGKCDAADAPGQCRSVKTTCDAPTEEEKKKAEDRTVCGCDGKTYATNCERRVAKVNLKSKGKCAG